MMKMVNKVAESVEELQENWKNPYMMWYAAGMPTFIMSDISAYRQVEFKFRTEEDRNAFAERAGFTLTKRTGYVWYPIKPHQKNDTRKIIEDGF